MPAQPDMKLHANRKHSVPTNDGPRACFSRSDILEGRTPAAFGSEQTAEIAVSGQKEDNPITWPKRWHRNGRVLRVPKCVILSSHPFWTLYYPKAYFYMPRDVIGEDGLGQIANYYYLEQWNGLDLSASAESDPDYTWAHDVGADAGPDDEGYRGNRAWDDMRNLSEEDKAGVYNARKSCMAFDQGELTCDDIPAHLFNKCQEPPKGERYMQAVAEVENPYYKLHPALLKAFLAAKKILEEDPDDPIYVVIPGWTPPVLRQVRNAFLKQVHEKLNGAHGGAVNKRPCDVSDAIPCHNHHNICWAPPYPDREDPRNYMGFTGPTVPWLLSATPGFGTNTLHMYIGHPNVSYFATDSPYDYQAWPLTPEVQWIAGPVFQGAYLGDPRPFFSGRRAVWRVSGFNYGYEGHGPEGLYDTRYGALVEGAASQYKDNFYKYRNFGTRIFTYDTPWQFGWNFGSLDRDRRNDCPATQFYFGRDFGEFAAEYSDEDRGIFDCSGIDPAHLAYGETINYFPLKAEIERAKVVGDVISRRVMRYYENVDKDSGDFFRLAIDRAGLADYNVRYEGGANQSFLEPESLVAYIRAYFKENR